MPKIRGIRPQALSAEEAALQAKMKQGLLLHQQGKLVDAELIYSEVLRQQPGNFNALHLLGVIACQTQRTEWGVELIRKAIKLDTKVADAHLNLGNALLDLNRTEEALASFDKAIALKPESAEAHSNRGVALRNLNYCAESLGSYQKAIALKPAYAQAYCNCGNTLLDLNRPEEALTNFDKAIALKPDYAEAYSNRSAALKSLRRPEEALASDDKAIALKPDYAEAYSNRGNTLRDLGHLEAALTNFDRSIALKPDYANAWHGRGIALADLKRFDEAVSAYDKALMLKPDLAVSWLGCGNVFFELRRYDEALSSYGKAFALKSDLAEAWLGRGHVFVELKRYSEAFSAYDKALALKPDLPEAWISRGNVFRELKRHAEALVAYDKALALAPDQTYAEVARLFSKMHLCNWAHFDAECIQLRSSVRRNRLAIPPFPILSISNSPDEQLQFAELFSKQKYPASDKPVWRGERYGHNRIRVAYLSADFRDHPVSYLLAGVFEKHDRKRFETIAISFGADAPSEILTRLKDSFDRFIDVKRQTDVEVARLLQTLEIDIAVDLMGYTTNSRTMILAHRPAPIQVNFLGYLGTMGAEYVDYIIADRIVIPELQREFYSEKIVYLPNSFQPTDRNRPISDKKFRRADADLPQEGFVFCCFNTNYKITPDVYDIWMRILNKVDGSVLWLFAEDSTVKRNLMNEAARRGVNPARLIFAPRISLPEHQARIRLADLFLDTLPYNAGATATDTLLAGTPVLTRMGNSFVGRMAASVLNAIGLPELITTTPEVYERMAIDLATNPEKLANIKRKLVENQRTMPLFDTKLFTKHIEAAYTTMYERYQARLAPDHIFIPNS